MVSSTAYYIKFGGFSPTFFNQFPVVGATASLTCAGLKDTTDRSLNARACTDEGVETLWEAPRLRRDLSHPPEMRKKAEEALESEREMCPWAIFSCFSD
jgi:hypothetical protein